MTKRIASVAATILVVLSSCCSEQDLELVSESETPQEECFTIPIETAMNNLEEHLQLFGISNTKGDSFYTISEVFPIMSNSEETKTTTSTTNTTAIYAVNFNEGGYAILSADARISEPVLAYVGQGRVSEDSFTYSSEESSVSSDDDISEEEYCKLLEEGYVGAEQPVRMINKAVLDYASEQIESYNDNHTTSDVGQWIVSESIPEMLKTNWHQDSPFNDLSPKVGLFKREKAAAGCVPIALAQIIAYHEYPLILKAYGTYIDYGKVKQICSDSYVGGEIPDDYKEMAAKFVKHIGDNSLTLYGKFLGKTFGMSNPLNAALCLKILDYDDVKLHVGYNENVVITSLKQNHPVFICGITHAWVIDGYQKKDYIVNDTVTNSSVLVHCNFGWRGVYDGYYISGVFNTDECVKRDYRSTGTNSHNYKVISSTITYSLPGE